MAELFSGRICLGFAESGISNGAMWSVPELGKKLALGDEIPSPIRGPTWMTRHVVDTKTFFDTHTYRPLCSSG